MPSATRMAALGGVTGLACAAACLSFDPFACGSDAACDRQAGGVCDPLTASCGYPDTSCPGTGLRFEEHAGGGLAGECVPGAAGTGSTDDGDGDGDDDGDDDLGSTGEDDDDPDDDGPDDGSDTSTSSGSDDDDDDDGDTTTGGPGCGGGGEPCCRGDVCDDGLSCLGDGCSCVAVLELGERHTCVAKLDGTVWCWGANDSGQLGQPVPPVLSTMPAEVPGAFGEGMAITALSAADHTCGLRDDDFAYCWGDNATGQCDPASVDDIETQPVLASWATGVTTVSAGGGHTCASRSTGVTTTCWGDNGDGQLASAEDGQGPYDQVAGFTLTQVAAGGSHTCGITATGAVYCWGDNTYGQIARDPDVTASSSAALVVTVEAATEIVAGRDHTCTRGASGVRCWGRGHLGQLGNEADLDSFAPVTAEIPLGAGAVASLTAGPNHTCARTQMGDLYCWGSNDLGQLMLVPDEMGNDMFTLTPVAIDVGVQTVQVSTGATHTCVLSTAGEILCWGTNASGQLGDGTTNYGFEPTPALLECP